MAQKDITDRFVIAGRPGARERVEVLVREKAGKKAKRSKFLERVTRPDFYGRANYRLPQVDVALIRDMAKRLVKLTTVAERLPWYNPAAFLFWVHAKEFRLDLMAMTVLDDDDLLVEFRRMLFNFDSKYLAFRPKYRPKFATRKLTR